MLVVTYQMQTHIFRHHLFPENLYFPGVFSAKTNFYRYFPVFTVEGDHTNSIQNLIEYYEKAELVLKTPGLSKSPDKSIDSTINTFIFEENFDRLKRIFLDFICLGSSEIELKHTVPVEISKLFSFNPIKVPVISDPKLELIKILTSEIKEYKSKLELIEILTSKIKEYKSEQEIKEIKEFQQNFNFDKLYRYNPISKELILSNVIPYQITKLSDLNSYTFHHCVTAIFVTPCIVDDTSPLLAIKLYDFKIEIFCRNKTISIEDLSVCSNRLIQETITSTFAANTIPITSLKVLFVYYPVGDLNFSDSLIRQTLKSFK